MKKNRFFHLLGHPDKGQDNYADALAKFWMGVSSVIMTVNLFFVLTLMQMAPQLKLTSLIVPGQPMVSADLYQAVPFEASVADKNLIDEMLLRNYIVNRYQIFPDEMEMKRRWSGAGFIASLSTPRVYNEFARANAQEIGDLRDIQYSQNVKIRKVTRFGASNKWEIDFDLLRLEGGLVKKQSKRAVLDTAEVPSRVQFRTNIVNPYGFTVVRYEDRKKTE